MTPSLFPLSTDKLWFCCLSPNHKVLQYGDVEDNASPPAPESLPEQRKEGRGRGQTPTPPDCPMSWDHVGPSGQPSFLSQSLWLTSGHY